MFKKSNVGDQLLIAVKLNKISEISRLVALGVDVNSRIDKVGRYKSLCFSLVEHQARAYLRVYTLFQKQISRTFPGLRLIFPEL